MNNYNKVSADMATQIKKNIEYDADGNRTGWVVQLQSIGQGNISSNLEYRFFQALLSGELSRSIYTLLIDQHNCPNLKSEMECTQTANAKMRDGGNVTVKKKTGDKLPTHRLPKESTNLTDALKYYVLRREVLNIYQRKASGAGAI